MYIFDIQFCMAIKRCQKPPLMVIEECKLKSDKEP
jgi:hypothetical protein